MLTRRANQERREKRRRRLSDRRWRRVFAEWERYSIMSLLWITALFAAYEFWFLLVAIWRPR